MSDPTAGTRGFVAGLIRAMEYMPDGEARDQVQALCDAVQARDSEGPVHWMTEDGCAVWVYPWMRKDGFPGLWCACAKSPPFSAVRAFPQAVRNTREDALAAVPDVLSLAREGEARRVGGRTGR